MSNPASIIAATFSTDSASIRECRYQGGRTNQAIYAIGDRYFAVGKKKPVDAVGQMWLEHKDQVFAKKAGTILWYSEEGERSIFDDVDE